MKANRGSSGNRAAGTLATAIATVTGNLYLIFGTVFFSVVAVVCGLLDRSGDAVFAVGRLWSRGILLTSGIRLEREVADDLPTGTPVVYMANHQSLFDIPVLFVSLPGQARMLAKRSLFRIPLFGWAIRLGGFISIDRENRSRAKESFDAAVDRLKSGASALIFPEGTRSAGDRLLPFQRGGMLLALKSGLPIVPVGIDGTAAIQPKERFTIRPGTVVVRYGSPIAVAGAGVRDRRALTDQVRREVARLANVQGPE